MPISYMQLEVLYLHHYQIFVVNQMNSQLVSTCIISVISHHKQRMEKIQMIYEFNKQKDMLQEYE